MRGKSSPECVLVVYGRQITQQTRGSMPLDELSSLVCAETLEERDDVIVRHDTRTRAVSRVKRDGFSRLERWPTALDWRLSVSAELPREA
jgi:hypothetical protein